MHRLKLAVKAVLAHNGIVMDARRTGLRSVEGHIELRLSLLACSLSFAFIIAYAHFDGFQHLNIFYITQFLHWLLVDDLNRSR